MHSTSSTTRCHKTYPGSGVHSSEHLTTRFSGIVQALPPCFSHAVPSHIKPSHETKCVQNVLNIQSFMRPTCSNMPSIHEFALKTTPYKSSDLSAWNAICFQLQEHSQCIFLALHSIILTNSQFLHSFFWVVFWREPWLQFRTPDSRIKQSEYVRIDARHFVRLVCDSRDYTQ